MRNEQVLPNKVNALYPGLGLEAPLHPMKEQFYPTKSRDCASAALSRSHSCFNSAVLHSSCSTDGCDREQPTGCRDSRKEKSVIAQPIFVFEKKERPYKRHAEDLVHSHKAENDYSGCPEKRVRSSSFTYSQSSTDENGSEKRVRSSSFTVLPTFPPSQLVKKNNVFMPSTLCQLNVNSTSTERESSSQMQQRRVLRPAILQPPSQVQLCGEEKNGVSKNIFTTCQIKDKSNDEVSSVTSSKTEKARGSHTCLDVSNFKTLRSQQAEGADNSTSDFVFGENMLERVLSPQKSSEFPVEKYRCKKGTSLGTESCQKTSTQPIILKKNITLVESAAAYISKSTHTCMLKKVDALTGEEAERNVLQINCKLFIFNKITQSWTERGRGSLRLNDTASNKYGTLQSRLVMRHQGSLRLIFNTKLWAQMKINRANSKCLCITATDLGNPSVQVFLIQASAKDIGSLYAAMHYRLVALRSSKEQDSDSNQMDPETEAGSQQLTYDSDDEEDEEVTQSGNKLSDHSRWIRQQPIIYS
ncbi:ran-binding protein 3-like isoform X2 [Microcaecilia unicolor]|uniref:Ran-binding protein 3-like n=1 Tax=Microcaecilia unicolor TaxID=1415580 RepID=A0A6P7XFA8_9AMPH|nr:ran-binding protein 3-like isoform X2 [Microcaecilia unicolor]